MVTFGAYAITLLLGQWVLLVGMYLPTLLIVLVIVMPLSKFTRTKGSPKELSPWERVVMSFVGGTIGSLCVFWLASLLFHWLLGPKSYSLMPFAATAASITPPMLNDWKTAKAMEASLEKMDEPIQAVFRKEARELALKADVAGYIVGLIIGYILFVKM